MTQITLPVDFVAELDGWSYMTVAYVKFPCITMLPCIIPMCVFDFWLTQQFYATYFWGDNGWEMIQSGWVHDDDWRDPYRLLRS